MNNKRTTAVLSILLILLIALLVLRSSGSLPWYSKDDNNAVLTAENSNPKSASREESTNAAANVAATNVAANIATNVATNVAANAAADIKLSSSPYAVIIDTAAETDKKPVKVPVEKPLALEDNSAIVKPVADKPAVDKPAAAKPTADKPAADKPAETSSAEIQTSSKTSVKKDLKPKTSSSQTADDKLKREAPRTSTATASDNKPKKAPPKTVKSDFKQFYVYSDLGSRDNHYMPYGFMGDIHAIKIDQGWRINPYGGKTCIRIAYAPTSANIGWAGIYWQHPANNWGEKGYGYNLTGAQKISFWAKGEKGGEVINNFIIGGIQGKAVEDSDSRAIGPIELTKEWRQYFIYLDGAKLTNIIGGFCVTFAKYNNEKGAVFYLDNIVYE